MHAVVQVSLTKAKTGSYLVFLLAHVKLFIVSFSLVFLDNDLTLFLSLIGILDGIMSFM